MGRGKECENQVRDIPVKEQEIPDEPREAGDSGEGVLTGEATAQDSVACCNGEADEGDALGAGEPDGSREDEYELVEMEIDEDDIQSYLVDEDDNEIGFTLLDEEGNEVEYYYAPEDAEEADGNGFDLGITKEGVAQATNDINAIYKDGIAIAGELKGAFDDIKEAFSFKAPPKK